MQLLISSGPALPLTCAMSASATAVRNGAARQALRHGLLPSRTAFTSSSAHSAYIRQNARNLPLEVRAIEILLPRRGYATDTSRTGPGGAGFPPPGFNVEEAKKPLPTDAKESSSEDADHVASVTDATSGAKGNGIVTGVEKTKAMEDRS